MTKQAGRGILDSPVQFLPGVGPHRAELFEKLGVKTVRDVVYYFPRRYIDARSVTPITELSVGQRQTIAGRVLDKSSRRLRTRGTVFSMVIADRTGSIECLWFGRTYMERRFSVGDFVLLVGKTRYYRGVKFYPEEEETLELDEEDVNPGEGKVIPVYGATQGLHHKTIRKIIERAVSRALGEVEETLPGYLLEETGLAQHAWAVEKMHCPADSGERDAARSRLAFEEFFFLEMLLALRHRGRNRQEGIGFGAAGELTKALLKELPFTLTGAQQNALRRIFELMGAEAPMNVLVQGDVGSGKTIVALFAMLHAVERGYTAALMAPTEVLAEQHYQTVERLAGPLGLRTELLTGAVKGKDRERVLGVVGDREPVILIGTHALIQEGVTFDGLGLVVVDEQHRFGVHQRVELVEKGVNPDCIVMTATPIPRSLAMTLYGDLDVIVIDELPPGRQKVVTKIVKEKDRQRVYAFIRDRVREGDQVFAVYPLVEESEKLALKDASRWHEKFAKEIFPSFRVSLVHGRMAHQEKEETMRRFREHEVDILVATTVIEVGVDVPEASIMLVEHAERFGLSQLHQLRGRIGRGTRKGYCLLFTDEDASGLSMKRLNLFARTTDGFEIAEADLTLRGPGELIGTRQHGIPAFRVADLVEDRDLLEKARALAFRTLQADPSLSAPENAVLRRELGKRYRRSLRFLRIG
jgi:ATP-dependent DNA helicase RecG